MSWTIEEYNALKSTIAKGLRWVEYDGKRVNYQDTQQMLKVLAAMEAELISTATGDGTRIGTVFTTYTRD